ncbi:MAG: PEP/pyruvate-binding domain-containing protein [Thermodesulfobacteriota bacterium]
MSQNRYGDRYDESFKTFHELMAWRVREILLISSPYDAFIMEEDGRIAGRIIHEYRGLNLTRPPRISWVSTGQDALRMLTEKQFDLVITMPRIDDMEPALLCREIKTRRRDLSIYFLAHDTSRFLDGMEDPLCTHIDRRFVWLGNTDLLLAMIKSTEDRLNVSSDTEKARVRVIILVEDSPVYLSSLLPFLYKEIVRQTQSAMDESINEEHRILRMRARPKILIAETFEDAQRLVRQFSPYLLSVLSDARFPNKGKLDQEAGMKLLTEIKQELPDLPLLLFSSEPANQEKAIRIQAHFINKNSPNLHRDIREFFTRNLGFDDFIFRLPGGEEVGRAANLKEMEKILPEIPEASILFHAGREDFSTWMMARSEIELASRLRQVKVNDFEDIRNVKQYLLASIRKQRRERQRGVIIEFSESGYDPSAEFVKIGNGSLGGKARGLAFLAVLLKNNQALFSKYPGMTVRIPSTLVISTEGFESFLNENDLAFGSMKDLDDARIEELFLKARVPDQLRRELELFLSFADYPLAVRSSGLLEDVPSQPSAGIYKTYMIPNNHPDRSRRLFHLENAVKRVYASTYSASSQAFVRQSQYRAEEDRMAVIIQQIIGSETNGLYYPAISGVAQSINFYPMGHMKAEEGVAHIALGFGRIVMDGGVCLRFSPLYPQLLPQFTSVEATLKNAQRSFYALRLPDAHEPDPQSPDEFMRLLSVEEVADHPVVNRMASTYVFEDHRIRDATGLAGQKLVTFAAVLKYNLFPLAEILRDILELGRRGMGCPVEIEFAVNAGMKKPETVEFALLQIRPMIKGGQRLVVEIDERDRKTAFCFSRHALGNGQKTDVRDILYVRPDTFDPARTMEMVAPIAGMNRTLTELQRPYLLIGPGRWGSADRWLGIPVDWRDIAGVGAIVETIAPNMPAEPSQGSHFFHNITALGISYITVKEDGQDFLDWNWLLSQPAESETEFIRHVHLRNGMRVKVDGRRSMAAVIADAEPTI